MLFMTHSFLAVQCDMLPNSLLSSHTTKTNENAPVSEPETHFDPMRSRAAQCDKPLELGGAHTVWH